jgi:hypothetical protein
VLSSLAQRKIVLTIAPTLFLAPRPKNDAKFLQALAQLRQEFKIPQKPSRDELLELITQQEKMFDREINQQRREIQEKKAKISESRVQLKNIMTQLTEEYASIKIKNKIILSQIDPQKNVAEMKIITDRLIKKIKSGNYFKSGADDASECFATFYHQYNVSVGQENKLKALFRKDCLKANMDQQISIMRNGSVGYYNLVTDTIKIVLVDLSNPESEWKIEQQKRDALRQEMEEISLTIRSIPQHIALMVSQMENRNKQIAELMLKKQELLTQ